MWLGCWLRRHRFRVLLLGLVLGVTLALSRSFYPPQVIRHETGLALEQSGQKARRGRTFELKESQQVNPRAGQDFLLSCWVKFNSLPVPGARVIFLAKYPSAGSVRPGFALALENVQGAARPVAYWQNRAGQGRWYSFAEMELAEGDWNLFTLSYTTVNILGLQVGSFSDQSESEDMVVLRSLGGHSVLPPVLPENANTLVIGSVAHGTFDGKIGPVGVFSLTSLEPRWDTILHDLAREPAALPRDLQETEVLYWSAESLERPRRRKLAHQQREWQRRSRN